jgi:hypothetical protein
LSNETELGKKLRSPICDEGLSDREMIHPTGTSAYSTTTAIAIAHKAF